MSGRRTADRKLTEVLPQWVQLRIPRKVAGSGGSSSAVGSVKNTTEEVTVVNSEQKWNEGRGSWQKGNGRGLECPLTAGSFGTFKGSVGR